MIEIQIQKGTEAHDRQGRNGQRAILLSQNVRDSISNTLLIQLISFQIKSTNSLRDMKKPHDLFISTFLGVQDIVGLRINVRFEVANIYEVLYL